MTIERALIGTADGGGADTDPNFENVTLLLHGDGTNGAQNNTFLDSSPNNFTITRYGNTTQGSFSPYGDWWSNYFDGSGDYLTTTSSAEFNFSNSDFTIEGWINSTQTTRVDPIGWNYAYTSAGWAGIILNVSASGQMSWYEQSNQRINATGTNWNNGAWNHIAVTRSGNSVRMFLNGVQVGATYTTSFSYGVSPSAFIIGQNATTDGRLNGYISNLRLVKGTAVYTSNFTPSTIPLTAISGTSLLTCQSNRFIDNSSNNFTITKYGDTKVTNFSPFSPSSAYSPAVNGGSGYFDGSGDYLDTPSSGQFAPSGDFTIGLWYYPTTTNLYQQTIGNFASNTPATWIIEVENGTAIWFYINGATRRIGGAGVTVNAWNYIALVRSGSTITGYVNGASIGTYSQSGVFGSASVSISIGRGGVVKSNDMASGYISNVRLVDGSAITTVPTSPLTAISGTSLLCNFTNAGIYDNSMKNDLETVGNAQISTSVKKFGTGSMYFDGSGDYLTLPSSSNLAFGTGDFTIECWAYFADSTERGVFQLSDSATYFKNTATNQISVERTPAGALYLGNNSGFNKSFGTVSSGSWCHIAIVRASGTINAYLNGTSGYSGADTTNYTASYFGVGAYHSTTYVMYGYIDDLRITKGVARYTANFTPPTQAFPNQ